MKPIGGSSRRRIRGTDAPGVRLHAANDGHGLCVRAPWLALSLRFDLGRQVRGAIGRWASRGMKNPSSTSTRSDDSAGPVATGPGASPPREWRAKPSPIWCSVWIHPASSNRGSWVRCRPPGSRGRTREKRPSPSRRRLRWSRWAVELPPAVAKAVAYSRKSVICGFTFLGAIRGAK